MHGIRLCMVKPIAEAQESTILISFVWRDIEAFLRDRLCYIPETRSTWSALNLFSNLADSQKGACWRGHPKVNLFNCRTDSDDRHVSYGPMCLVLGTIAPHDAAIPLH